MMERMFEVRNLLRHYLALRTGLSRQALQHIIILPTLAIVDTSNSAHSISSVASNGYMHVDQDAVSKHDMELNNTSPPHQPIIGYMDSNADDGQAKDKAMLLAAGTVQLSSSALYQNGTIACAECLDFSTADPQLYGLRRSVGAVFVVNSSMSHSVLITCTTEQEQGNT